MNPDKTSSSLSTKIGIDSPVKADVSTAEEPSMTLPSRGIFSRV